MPNASTGNLGIGAGIAGGVSAFTQAFFQARQQKNMMELQKNSRLADLLMDQIKDDNTPHSTRTALVDEYQKLIDPKGATKQPLSQILGLHKLDDSDYQIGTEQPSDASKASVIQQSQSPTNPDVIKTGPAPNPSEVTFADNPITKKYGDLTPNDIKQKLQLDLEKVRDEREIEHAKKLYQAQTDILGKNGYTIPISDSYDPDTKVYSKVMANSSGETKTITLNNFKPTTLAKAEITATSKSDKPSVFVRDQMRYWQSQVNPETNQPYTLEESSIKALGDAHNKFTSTESLKEAQTTALSLGNTGLKPITPAQSVDDIRANQDREDKLTGIVDENRRQGTLAAAELDSLGKLKGDYDKGTGAWGNYKQAEKELKAFQKENGPDAATARDSNPSEYARLEDNMSKARIRAENLDHQYGIVAAKNNSYKQSLTDAQKRLDEHKKQTSGKGNSTKNPYQSNIDQFRKDNPSATISDSDIIKLLRGKRIIK